MNPASLSTGVELMLIGMGTVFVFLTLLVMATSAMSALVGRNGETVVRPATTGPTDEELAVIGAAVTQYRRAALPPDSR